MKYKLTTLLIMEIKNEEHLRCTLDTGSYNKAMTDIFTKFETAVERHNGTMKKDPMGRYPETGLSSFDGPTAALRTACSFMHDSAQSKAEVSCAINTGEIVLRNNAIMGRTLDITSRLAAVAEKGQVLFTESVLLSAGCDSELVYHPHLTSLEGVSGPQMSIFRLEKIGEDDGES